MKTIAMALAAASLSLTAALPASAQESRVTVNYGDLDLASPAGSEALFGRLVTSVRAACERPDIRDLKAVTAWEDCKDRAMSSALEQLAVKGVRVG